jgi:dTDP-4-amino-4,6-dideoxygalactose transaminase
MTSPSIEKRNVPLLDLAAQQAPIREELLAAMARVLDSKRFIMGPEVDGVEAEMARYCGVEHAIGCASGTDALMLALLAADVLPGDRVITTPFTFFATAGAIARVNAIPVFVDIDPVTFNLSSTALSEAIWLHESVKAILPVHLFGACADMDPILDAAASRAVPVIEDAAQAIGAEYKGRRAGGLGAMAGFSFFPSKNLGACGDAGMVTTNDANLAAQLKSLRNHGSEKKYFHSRVGINSRLDALQAAVLRVKLPYLDGWTAKRQKNAALYNDMLAGSAVTIPPADEPATRHVFNQYVIRAPRRDELKAYLEQNGVATEVYYPLSLHQQECFAYLGYREGQFPESERAAKEVLALPLAEVTADDIGYVARLIRRFYE